LFNEKIAPIVCIMIYAFGLLVLLCVGLYGVLLGRGFVVVPQALEERRWVTILGFVLMFASADIAITWSYAGTMTPLQALRKVGTPRLADMLALAMRMRLDLPVQVNDNVSLYDLRSKENIVIYKMAINVSAYRDFVAVAEGIRGDLLKNACDRDNYKKLLKYGLGIEVDLSAANGWDAEPVVITPQSCGY
jgi:hypothetical protein